MTAGSRVLIVGGGLAGLSAALSLRRAGVAVDVVEADRKWSVDDIGMIVHANFIRAMAALGIAADTVAVGFPWDGASLEDGEGNLISRVHGVRLAGRAFPSDLGISRVALHKLLAGAVLASGAQVRLGLTFSRIQQNDQRATVTLSDGSVGTYDLVVGADGVHSKVREHVFGSRLQPQFTGQHRWRCKIRRRPDIDSPFVRVREDGTRYGYMPVSARSGCVMVLDCEPVDPNCPRERLPQLLRSRLARCTGKLAELRDEVADPAHIVCRPIEVVFVQDTWYRGRVLLIGDASHAMTAHLAQGAAQAVEDGVVLGELFARGLPVPDLLEAFMLRRYSRCKLIAETTLLTERSGHFTATVPDLARVTEHMLAVAASPI